MQGGGKLATFLCGGVVEFPGDFRQLLEGVEVVTVYSQFGDMEMLVGVERHLEVESDRFTIREESKGFSDDSSIASIHTIDCDNTFTHIAASSQRIKLLFAFIIVQFLENFNKKTK